MVWPRCLCRDIFRRKTHDGHTQRKTHVHSYGLRDTNTLSLYKFNNIKYEKLSLRYEAAISGISYYLVFNVYALWIILRKVLKSIKTWKRPFGVGTRSNIFRQWTTGGKVP